VNARRREFIGAIGAAAASWSHALHAQERVRRVGVLMNTAPDHPEGKARLAIFRQALEALGWTEGRNVRIELRGTSATVADFRKSAAELLAAAPDVVLAITTNAVLELQRASRSVPIVFAQAVDPVGSGLVRSLARPGGSATGFVTFEYSISAKWLDLLKEIAPGVTRIAVLRTAAAAAGIGQFSSIQTVAPIGVELSVIGTGDTAEVERAIAGFASQPNGGLVVTASGFGANHPKLIAELATRYNLPAVYPFRYYVTAGGLICYGPDESQQYRLAAGYVDRILKGEKPADLPVQAPTKYELVINSRPRRRSASPCRPPCSPAPTR
jgi:putative ABC transport system substrate-binding protein